MSVGNPTKVSHLGSVAGLGTDTFKVLQIKKIPNSMHRLESKLYITFNPKTQEQPRTQEYQTLKKSNTKNTHNIENGLKSGRALLLSHPPPLLPLLVAGTASPPTGSDGGEGIISAASSPPSTNRCCRRLPSRLIWWKGGHRCCLGRERGAPVAGSPPTAATHEERERGTGVRSLSTWEDKEGWSARLCFYGYRYFLKPTIIIGTGYLIN